VQLDLDQAVLHYQLEGLVVVVADALVVEVVEHTPHHAKKDLYGSQNAGDAMVDAARDEGHTSSGCLASVKTSWMGVNRKQKWTERP
jgi:hypothetical protein